MNFLLTSSAIYLLLFLLTYRPLATYFSASPNTVWPMGILTSFLDLRPDQFYTIINRFLCVFQSSLYSTSVNTVFFKKFSSIYFQSVAGLIVSLMRASLLSLLMSFLLSIAFGRYLSICLSDVKVNPSQGDFPLNL